MTLLLDTPAAAVVRGDWRTSLALVTARGGCDLLCVDAPYSERTHAGHDDGIAQVNRVRDWAGRQPSGRRADGTSFGGQVARVAEHGGERRALSYPAWNEDDVYDFVTAWVPVTRGWIVSLTDHMLAPVWEAALLREGRYVFAPLACVEPGSRVRFTGDGPSNWTTWAVVARPSTAPFAKWGTLPGAYVVPAGHGDTRTGRREEDLRVVGGKPLWLMSSLCRDYSRKGDLVCDPCAGAGTTGVAARTLGRRFIGGDVLAEHAALAARNVGAAREQLALWGDGT